MTKQHPLCLSVARSDEIDGEHSDNVGMNIKSPAFLPCKEWSFAEVSQGDARSHVLISLFSKAYLGDSVRHKIELIRYHTNAEARFFDSPLLCRQALLTDMEIMQLM